MSHYEIIKLLAKEFDMPKEQIDIIIADFWNGVKYYLENPIGMFIKGVTIKGLITFEFRSTYWFEKKINSFKSKIVRYRDREREKTEKEKEKSLIESIRMSKILNQLKYGKHSQGEEPNED